MSLDELYQELLLDHFKKPRCHGCIADASAHSHVFNPLCGDQIAVTVKVGEDKLQDIKFTGHGCSISQASASLMSELCQGKQIEVVRRFIAAFQAMMRGESHPDKQQLGDVLALEGVRKFSARIRCALLGWEALERCLNGGDSKPPPAK
ncbi:MAG: SUF system NifU family Fe-S cluster assembly protein [Oligoflexia bacterium]|nr:SUF system NifU family Fe-S cluster assembly protein [Oligoflexia bacterium]